MAQQVFAGAKDISVPLQYQVLKRAKGRCELYGISDKEGIAGKPYQTQKQERPPTVLENLQALRNTCNAQKQNLYYYYTC